MKSTGLIVLSILLAFCEQASAAQSQMQLTYRGTTSMSAPAVSATQDIGLEIRPGLDVDAVFSRLAKGAVSPARVPADHVPTPSDSGVSTTVGGAGFDGLTHRDQRLASSGNQFSTEPPDQALAVGNGYVVEAVNLAIRVRTTDGNIVVPAIGLNAFFRLAPSIDRATGTFGPFTSDPKAYFDADAQRWFVSLLEIDDDPQTGAFLGHSAVLLAVSQTSNPAGSWYLYSIDTTNATGTSDHAGCPCFGDQPLIGADRYGFYVSTNEFPIFADGFNGAQVYAISKARLVAGPSGSIPVVAFSGLPLAEGTAYSLQPSITAQGGAHDIGRGGTEYFLSALDFNNALDNRVAVWSLTNTQSLSDTVPSVVLQNTIIASQVYGAPPSTQQRPGPTPLADLIKSGAMGKASQQILPLIDGNDDRMQQVTWADGKLWSSLNTVVKPEIGPVHSGAAYFIVAPTWSGNALGAAIVKQGYVSLSHNSVLYPSVGVNTSGRGVMAFSLAGDSYYPSAAYVRIDGTGQVGPIQIIAPGVAPDDGFTGYAFFGGRVGRWGDYSAAVADAGGTIWFANEYIPAAPRTVLANWGTFIGRVAP
jgi:hypothetical protein